MKHAQPQARGRVRPKRMFSRAAIARVSIGLVLGLVLGVVLEQANTRNNDLYGQLLGQGAFGADNSATVPSSFFTSSYTSSSCHQAGDNCDDGGGCCDPLYNCIDDNGDENFICRLMSSSYSSSVPQYCCSGAGICEEVFLGLTTCVGAETSDPTCGGTCSSSSSSSSEQWCCIHTAPTGPGNCSML